MPIQFICPACSKQHQISPDLAGRQARCTCGTVFVVPALSSQPPIVTPPNSLPVRPAAPPRVCANPNSASSGPANPVAWEAEPAKYSNPAAKPSPLAKLFAEQRALVIGIGAGVGLIFLLTFTAIAWMLFPQGGISEAMRYFPNDCLVVGTTNVDQWMNSSIYQQMKKDLPGFEFDERNAEQLFGIAPANIRQITFAVGGKSNFQNDPAAVMVIRLKTPVSATDIKSNKKVQGFQTDVEFEEVKIGSFTVFEETYCSTFGDKAERRHGAAFCLPASTVIVVSPKLEVLKRILERGKSPEISEGMQLAMSEADFSKTMAVAINIKGLMTSEGFSREFKNSGIKGLEGLDEQFLQEVIGLAADASLDSSKVTMNATLLCKEAKFAEDAKKILDGGQVVARNALKAGRAVPREVLDVVDSIKFSVSGATVKGYLQTSLDPFSKWIKDRADKR